MSHNTPEPLARPYRMHNQIQNYAWGTRGENAFIPRLVGLDPEPGEPYAELWMGAHPKAPSHVEIPGGDHVSLQAWIADHPQATLGQEIASEFGDLPFLLKVLSAGQSLSIQAHPNKAQAAQLHRTDPEHYPDDNHKPEIAIALDHLTALVGFKPYPVFVRTLSRYPELSTFLGRELVTRAACADQSSDVVQSTIIREVFATLVQRAGESPEELGAAVDALARRLTAGFERADEAEQRFLSLRERYGNQDIGLFALLLFNVVYLNAGEAIYIDAGMPHAYLEGNIVECMANSDNVVRVGLTPKFRDAKALLRIIDTEPRLPEILNGSPTPIDDGTTVATYEVPTPEFRITRFEMASNAACEINKEATPAVLLVTSGSVDIIWNGGLETYGQGATAFIPACLRGYSLAAQSSAEVIIAEVPET